MLNITNTIHQAKKSVPVPDTGQVVHANARVRLILTCEVILISFANRCASVVHLCVFVSEVEVAFLLSNVAHILVLPVDVLGKSRFSWGEDIGVGVHYRRLLT